MTGLLAASVVVVIRARSTLSRVLALDMLILILIALLVLFADAQGVVVSTRVRICGAQIY
jgi:multisubunit Na+/H+ antiporter MnhF subunit